MTRKPGLEKTKVTAAIDLVTTPTDRLSDGVTNLTDRWVDRGEDPANREALIGRAKKIIRWGGRLAAGALTVRTGIDVIETFDQFGTPTPGELIPDGLDYGLMGTWVMASVLSTERGKKKTTVEHRIGEYVDPADVGGLYYDPDSDTMKYTEDDTEASDLSIDTEAPIVNEDGSASGMFFDTETGAVLDGVFHRPDLLVDADGNVLDLTTAEEEEDFTYDATNDKFIDDEGNELNYSYDAYGVITDNDSGSSAMDVRFNPGDGKIYVIETAEAIDDLVARDDLRAVFDGTLGCFTNGHAVDLETRVAYYLGTGEISRSTGAHFDEDSGHIVLSDGRHVDPLERLLINADGTPIIVDTQELRPSDPVPADTVESIRTSTRKKKKSWSKRTSVSPTRPEGSVESVRNGSSDIMHEVIDTSRDLRIKRKERQVKKASKKAGRSGKKTRNLQAKVAMADEAIEIRRTSDSQRRSNGAYSPARGNKATRRYIKDARRRGKANARLRESSSPNSKASRRVEKLTKREQELAELKAKFGRN